MHTVFNHVVYLDDWVKNHLVEDAFKLTHIQYFTFFFSPTRNLRCHSVFALEYFDSFVLLMWFNFHNGCTKVQDNFIFFCLTYTNMQWVSCLFPYSDSLRASKHYKLSTKVSSWWTWTIWNYSHLSRNIYKKLCWLFCYHIHTGYWRQVILILVLQTYAILVSIWNFIVTVYPNCAPECSNIFFVCRHLDNLLLRDDGRLFHVDFGYILGRDPKPFPPPMKLCKEMVEAMGGAERFFSNFVCF